MVTQVPKMLALVGLYFLRHLPCVYGNDSEEREERVAWYLSSYNFKDVHCEDYIIGELISSGGFSDVQCGVYEIQNLKSGRNAVAKISLVHPRGTSELDYENRVLQKLSEKDNVFKEAVGEIDFIENVGFQDDGKTLTKVQKSEWGGRPTFQILIMDNMGLSLEEMSKNCGGKIKGQSIFKRKIIDLLAVQYLDRIEEIHAAGILHMDIKPGNTMFQEGQIFLIDFGLSLITASDDGYVGEYCLDNRGLEGQPRGTLRYMPTAVMRIGEAPERKHDLESILYTLLDFENILPDHTSERYDIQWEIREILDGRAELRRRVCSPRYNSAYGMKYCLFFRMTDEMNVPIIDSRPNYEALKELFRKNDKNENGCFKFFSRGAQNLDGDWCQK